MPTGALRLGWLLAVSSGAARPCGLPEQGPPSAQLLPSVPMQGDADATLLVSAQPRLPMCCPKGLCA